MNLRRASDLALVLAVVVVVVAIVKALVVLALLAVALFALAVGLTVVKRRRGRAPRP